jgi:hypothetical protein
MLGGLMMRFTGTLVPPEVVTVTLMEPVGALVAMVKVTLICVELMTLTLLTVTPGLLTFTVAPETKLEPVRVTFKLVPAVPLFGLIEVSVGADSVGGLIVKPTELLVPPGVITVTFAEPEAAFAKMRNVAAI